MDLLALMPYLLIALSVVSIGCALLRWLSPRPTTKPAHFREFQQEADALGDAARKKAEEEVDAMFAPYLTKEKAP